MRLPGVRDLRGSTEERQNVTGVRAGRGWCRRSYSQSGLVGGGVVGQPTTVSQTLHHLEAGDRRQSLYEHTLLALETLHKRTRLKLTSGL